MSVQLCAAFPAGYLADRGRRDVMLRVSAVLGALAGASLLAAVYLQLPMPYFYLALSLMGLYRGFSNPPLESIYADSVPTGTRSAQELACSAACWIEWGLVLRSLCAAAPCTQPSTLRSCSQAVWGH